MTCIKTFSVIDFPLNQGYIFYSTIRQEPYSHRQGAKN